MHRTLMVNISALLLLSSTILLAVTEAGLSDEIGEKRAVTGQCETDLVLVLDTSGSVEQVHQRKLELVTKLISGMADEQVGTAIHVAAISFNSFPQLVINLEDKAMDKEKMVNMLNRIRHTGGRTATATAVEMAIDIAQKGRRPGAKLVFLLLTDGFSGDAWPTVVETSRRLGSVDAFVFAVTLSRQFYYPELLLYAGDNERILTLHDKGTAESIQQLLEEIVPSSSCIAATSTSTTTKAPFVKLVPRPVEGTGAQECRLAGVWQNNLCSKLYIKEAEGDISGFFLTAVESYRGAAGRGGRVVRGMAQGSLVTFHVVWTSSRSLTTWVGQCYNESSSAPAMMDLKIETSWILTSQTPTDKDHWKVNRLGKDAFVKVAAEGEDGSRADCQVGAKPKSRGKAVRGQQAAATPETPKVTVRQPPPPPPQQVHSICNLTGVWRNGFCSKLDISEQQGQIKGLFYPSKKGVQGPEGKVVRGTLLENLVTFYVADKESRSIMTWVGQCYNSSLAFKMETSWIRTKEVATLLDHWTANRIGKDTFVKDAEGEERKKVVEKCEQPKSRKDKTDSQVCSLTGSWQNGLCSKMHITEQEGRINGRYFTAVESFNGSAGSGGKVVRGTQFGQMVTFHVAWDDAAMMTTWVGQCYIEDETKAQLKIDTTWITTKEMATSKSHWAANRYGKDIFTKLSSADERLKHCTKPPITASRASEPNKLRKNNTLLAVEKLKKCNLTGVWRNSLGSRMYLTEEEDGQISGRYLTAVESFEGASGNERKSIRGRSLGSLVTFHVVYKQSGSLATWVGQCFDSTMKLRIRTSWLLASSGATAHKRRAANRYGKDPFIKIA